MYRYVPVLMGFCFVLGCADRTPLDPNLGAPHEESVAANLCYPREVLDRAIVAIGGDSAREKLKICKMTTRCVMAIPAAVRAMGDDTFLIEDGFCYPDKWRRTMRRGSDGADYMLFVLNGDSLWTKSSDKKVQAMPSPAPNMRKPAIINMLDNIAELRESKREIVAGPDEEEAGQTLIPLTTMARGRPRMTTYFDRSTGLMVKEVKYYLPDVNAPPETWKKKGPVETETTYGDYKSFEGVMLPTHMVMSQGGKIVLDVTVLQVEFPSTLDASLFDKPQD
jgi:hypothetical protein